MIKSFFYLWVLFFFWDKNSFSPHKKLTHISYHFSNTGNDNNDGSVNHPLRTINFLNALILSAGDSILLKGGDIFKGNIILQVKDAVAEMPVTLTSYGNGYATINAENTAAITINQSSFININSIHCKGAGRKDGNLANGIYINQGSYINMINIDVSGFQKSGLLVYRSLNVDAENVYAHDNDFAGISISGENKKDDCAHIHITHCHAENNPGDPTNFTNHSGNGIIAGFCKDILIEYCTANNNDWDMPRIGNGPVGIWCYEADSVIIQHCISYQNKTSKGGEDGGGYDFDGGTTHSIIQYCLSYENQGSAFGIFQYAGASKWHDNVIRFCISENDGNVSAAHANAYIWSSSQEAGQFTNFLFYSNTIYNNENAALSYSVKSLHSNFKFYNNIFIGSGTLINGNYTSDVFVGNDWRSLKNNFTIEDNHDFNNWCLSKNKEHINGIVYGLNVMPSFKNAGHATITNAEQLADFSNYNIIDKSPVIHAGIDLQALYHIDIGSVDFNGNPPLKNCMGACTHK